MTKHKNRKRGPLTGDEVGALQTANRVTADCPCNGQGVRLGSDILERGCE